MANWHSVSGNVTAPKGFRAAGVTAGFKASGALDLALIVSDTEAITAGVFTQSAVRAACVDYCRVRLQETTRIRALLCNSGQANAGTGKEGWQDALQSAQWLGSALDVDPDSILLASTGVIGQRLKMHALETAIPKAIEVLSPEGGDMAAQAILTTDLVPKAIALEMELGGRPVRIGGIAKGSGMIHPNMATMLSFITCDAAVSTQLWQGMLARAVDKSFNQITVDGDTSTNDCVLALANGQSRTAAITDPDSEAAQLLEAMLTDVCQYLAKCIARDGEGATCLMEVQVSGAVDDQSARTIARTVAGSSLVKSAIFGRDPNWGRIAAAAGRAGIPFHQEDLQVSLGEFRLMDQGQPLDFDRAAASDYLKARAAGAYLKDDTVVIRLSIGQDSGQGVAWGCDLSYDYVRINAEYTT